MKRGLLERLRAARTEKKPVVLATHLVTGAQCLIADGAQIDGDLPLDDNLRHAADDALRCDKALSRDGLFLQIFNPPLRMIIIGAVHITQTLAPMAQLIGYQVSVVDPRGAWANQARFPSVTVLQDWPEEALNRLAPDRRTAIVALTHDPKLDDPALIGALESDAFYIGALGSRKTAAARAGRLRETGISEADIARIDGPIGLNIGATSPSEISLAILGQITLTLRGAKPAPLPDPAPLS